MACQVGMDIGAVSIQAVVLADPSIDERLKQASASWPLVRLEVPGDQTRAVWVSVYRRTRGRALEAAASLLDELIRLIGGDDISGLAVAGSAADVVANKLGVEEVNEFKMIARAVTSSDKVSCPTNSPAPFFNMAASASSYPMVFKKMISWVSIAGIKTAPCITPKLPMIISKK